MRPLLAFTVLALLLGCATAPEPEAAKPAEDAAKPAAAKSESELGTAQTGNPGASKDPVASTPQAVGGDSELQVNPNARYNTPGSASGR
jgi:hypothetical protein